MWMPAEPCEPRAARASHAPTRCRVQSASGIGLRPSETSAPSGVSISRWRVLDDAAVVLDPSLGPRRGPRTPVVVDIPGSALSCTLSKTGPPIHWLDSLPRLWSPPSSSYTTLIVVTAPRPFDSPVFKPGVALLSSPSLLSHLLIRIFQSNVAAARLDSLDTAGRPFPISAYRQTTTAQSRSVL